jgi:hypothetical protein
MCVCMHICICGTYAYWLLQSAVSGTGDMPSWLMGTIAKSCPAQHARRNTNTHTAAAASQKIPPPLLLARAATFLSMCWPCKTLAMRQELGQPVAVWPSSSAVRVLPLPLCVPPTRHVERLSTADIVTVIHSRNRYGRFVFTSHFLVRVLALQDTGDAPGAWPTCCCLAKLLSSARAATATVCAPYTACRAPLDG